MKKMMMNTERVLDADRCKSWTPFIYDATRSKIPVFDSSTVYDEKLLLQALGRKALLFSLKQ